MPRKSPQSILLLAHVPPPLHGASLVGQQVRTILESTDDQIYAVNLSGGSSVDRAGSLSAGKIFHLIYIFLFTITVILFKRPTLIYLTPAVSGRAIYRDVLLTLVIKFFTRVTFSDCRLLHHIHMRPDNEAVSFSSWMMRRLLTNCELVVASEALLEDYAAYLAVIERIHIIPYSVDPITTKERSVRMLAERSRMNTGPKRVLYFAHLIPSKGYLRALKVAAVLLSRRSDIEFNFAGSCGEADRALFDDFIESNCLANSVKYHGRCSDLVKEELFLEADVFILPSYSEAYPLTILEAFSVGCPVVATDTGAISSLVSSERGIAIDQEGSEEEFISAFALAVENIADDWPKSKRPKLLEHFFEAYSTEKFKERIIKLVSSVK